MRTILTMHALALPQRVGDPITLSLPVRAKVRGLLMSDGRVCLTVEARADRTEFETRTFVAAVNGVPFELPHDATYVGVVDHPRHGPVHVYDALP